MRTTLDIDENVLHAVKELAKRRGSTAGELVSELLRQALTQTSQAAAGTQEKAATYGFRPLQARGALTTNELVNKLRDESGI